MSDPQPEQQEIPFAWDNDDSLGGALSIIATLITDAEGAIGRMSALESSGLDPDLLRTKPAQFTANEMTLILTGLQGLGVAAETLRPLLTELLYKLHDLSPDLDEEVEAQCNAAIERFMEHFMGDADEIGRQFFANPNGSDN